MAKSNRSTFLKERHQRAREQQKYYEVLTGDANSNYSDFLKTQTPLTQRVVRYEVSYQLSYSGGAGSLFIKSPETYEVYAIENDMTSDKIYQGTKDAVINMKKENSGFQLGTQKMINNNLVVDVAKIEPRGLEKSPSSPVSNEVISQLVKGKGFYVKAVDENVLVSGGKKNSSSGTRETKMKTDLSLYIN